METKDILKMLRKQNGMTGQEVADGCGMTYKVYQAYESGARNLGVPALQKLADFYDVTTDYLLGRTETPPPNPVKQLSDDELEQDMIETYIQLPKPVRIQILQMMVDTVRKNEERKRKAAIVNSQMVARSDKPPNQYTSEQDAQLLSEPGHPEKF